MPEVSVKIVHFLGADSPPGWVECELFDLHGRRWTFIEKTAIVCEHFLDAESIYPQQGAIAGEIVFRKTDEEGREFVRFSTKRPWGVESVEGETEFDLWVKQLADFEPPTEP